MAFRITRRNWLKSSAALAAGSFITSPAWSTGNRKSDVLPTGEIRPNLHTLDEYANPAAIKVRLNANENAYGPSKAAKEALQNAIDSSFRYPFSEIKELKAQIASKHNLTTSQVTIGGGSTEILTMAGMAFGLQHGAIVSAYPTFETLFRTAKQFDCEWIQVHLDKDFKHDLSAIENAITSNTKLVYICNPNNPTGTLIDQEVFNDFCKRVSQKVPVFVDEAYTEFLDDPEAHTVIPLINEGYDIIVAKTFSKVYGMAGLRVGYALAPEKRIIQLEKHGVSLSIVSKTSVAAAAACLNDSEFVNFSRNKNKGSKEIAYRVIKEAGYRSYIESSTSFIMFPIEMEGKSFLSKMEKLGVGVRAWNFDNKNWCRVSLGKPDDMLAFGEALKKIS